MVYGLINQKIQVQFFEVLYTCKFSFCTKYNEFKDGSHVVYLITCKSNTYVNVNKRKCSLKSSKEL